jgi:hypothetical protein
MSGWLGSLLGNRNDHESEEGNVEEHIRQLLQTNQTSERKRIVTQLRQISENKINSKVEENSHSN